VAACHFGRSAKRWRHSWDHRRQKVVPHLLNVLPASGTRLTTLQLTTDPIGHVEIDHVANNHVDIDHVAIDYDPN